MRLPAQLLLFTAVGLHSVTVSAESEQCMEDARAGNWNAAYESCKDAAEAGDAASQYALSELYRNGNGIGRDPNKAFEWAEQAAEQGLTAAQANLGSSQKTENKAR